MTNHFAYCGNSPYIYVDPDGNAYVADDAGIIAGVVILVAAIIGSVAGTVSYCVTNGIHSFRDVLMAIIAGLRGGAIAACSAYNAGLGMLAGIGDTLLDPLIEGHPEQYRSGQTWGGMGIGAAASVVGSLAASGTGAILRGAATWVTRAVTSVVSSAASMLTSQGLRAASGMQTEDWDKAIAGAAVSAAARFATQTAEGEIEARAQLKPNVVEGQVKEQSDYVMSLPGQNADGFNSWFDGQMENGLPTDAQRKLGDAFDQLKTGEFDTPGNQVSEYTRGLNYDAALGSARLITGNDVPWIIRAYWKVVKAFTGFETGATTLGDKIYWNDSANGRFDSSNPGHLSLLGHEVVHVAQSQAQGRSYIGRWIKDFCSMFFRGKTKDLFSNYDRYLDTANRGGGRMINSYRMTRAEQQAYGIGDSMYDNYREFGW